MRTRKMKVLIVSIIDNPDGLAKQVLQLMEQESIVIKYINASHVQFGGPQNQPLRYWEEKVGSPLMDESILTEPKDPPIISWETNRILRPFEAYLLGRQLGSPSHDNINGSDEN